MTAAAARFAALPEPDDSEAIRGDLLARIQRLVETEAEIVQWEGERNAYLHQIGDAARHRAPLPPLLRPAPATEADLERIAEGGY